MYASRHSCPGNLKLNPAQIEEVKGVVQVLDQEEEIALAEFAKFEEKLKLQRGAAAASASTSTISAAN